MIRRKEENWRRRQICCLEMHEFMEQQGYELDITDKRLHHEIYLSDARKVAPEKLKTVIRHPIKEKEE